LGDCIEEFYEFESSLNGEIEIEEGYLGRKRVKCKNGSAVCEKTIEFV